jgi:hypothetical protein
MRAADWGESPDPEPGAGVRERVPRPRRCMSPSHVSWSSTRSSTGTQRTRDSSTTRATRGNGPTGRTRPDLPSRPGNPGATPSPTNHEVGERRPLSPLPCGGPPPPHTDGAGRPSRACVRRPRTRVLPQNRCPRSSRIRPANDRETSRKDGNGRSIESAGQVADSAIAAGSKIGPENTLKVETRVRELRPGTSPCSEPRSGCWGSSSQPRRA